MHLIIGHDAATILLEGMPQECQVFQHLEHMAFGTRRERVQYRRMMGNPLALQFCSGIHMKEDRDRIIGLFGRPDYWFYEDNRGLSLYWRESMQGVF